MSIAASLDVLTVVMIKPAQSAPVEYALPVNLAELNDAKFARPDRVLELAQRTVKEARRVIEGLSPTALDDFGLVTALRQRVEELDNEGLKIGYEETLGEVRLPLQVETALYRISQEALTNVQKHAQTNEARRAGTPGTREGAPGGQGRGVRVRPFGGIGGPGERVGLSGMQERATLLGGELRIASRRGEGTSAAAEVPLLPTCFPAKEAYRAG